MYESWIILSDVGGAPDWRGEWPKLAIAHITDDQPFGMVSLGDPKHYMVHTFGIHRPAQIEAVLCPVQYFNDGDSDGFESRGSIVSLDVKPLYMVEECPIMLVCDDITQAVYETYVAFDTLPVMNMVPLKK